MTSVLRFTVLGRPQGKGSKRVLPIRTSSRVVLVDSNRNAAPWATRVSSAALHAFADVGRSELMRGAVAVELTFRFARPRSHFGTGRNRQLVRASAPNEMTTMPDIDKLARCALDALSGIVFYDDAQVSALRLRKVYGEPESLEVTVHEL